MERVTGLGGIFFRAEDPTSLGGWYRRHLGIPVNDSGCCDFRWRDADDPARLGRTVWSLFPADSDYLGSGESEFMINYWVADLDGLLAALREEGVDVEDRIEEHEYGRFAWVTDPEGNRIELWEPAGEERR